MPRLLSPLLPLPLAAALVPAAWALGGSHTAPDAEAAATSRLDGGPGRPLSPLEQERWDAGREFFRREMTAGEGLGPAFNAASCATCHLDPATGGAGGLEFNVRMAGGGGAKSAGAADAVTRYLRLRETMSVQEACERLRGLEREAQKRLQERLGDPRQRAELVAGTIQTPSILGLGLLEGVPEDEILGREDPDDRDGDGVRGVAQRVQVGSELRVGRFGWRADLPTLNDFARAACGGELGLTVPAEVGFGLTTDGDLVLDPEMTWGALDALVFFCRELAPPARGGREGEPEVRRGEQVFARAGCAACHVPALYGAGGPVHAYTDLLLHAVAAEEGGAPAPFRTAPLWGVRATAPYLHDGRAFTLLEAVQWHAGEAEGARRSFDALSAGDQEALLAFLADL